jgi:hypothetical protein
MIDWDYVRECRLARHAGAFWCDPAIYDGTSLAWPKPSDDTLRKVYEESRAEAVARFGEERVTAAAWEVARHTDLRTAHLRSADPFAVVMSLAG